MDFDQDQIVAGLGVLTGYPVAEDNGQTSASEQSGPLSFAPMSLRTLSQNRWLEHLGPPPMNDGTEYGTRS
jgi:hypothetical protein